MFLLRSSVLERGVSGFLGRVSGFWSVGFRVLGAGFRVFGEFRV